MGTLIKSRTNGNATSPALPSLFNDFLTRDLFDWPFSGGWVHSELPSVNIRELDDSYVMEVAAPGMRKEDFHVELDQDNLVISGQVSSTAQSGPEDGRYTLREFSVQGFKRMFALPENRIEADKITAHYERGILSVTLPKSAEARKKPCAVLKSRDFQQRFTQ